MLDMDLVTADSVDPLYNRPVIDQEIDVMTPVPYRKVSGHFEGTDKKFNIYLPPKSQWNSRFFQLVYPLIDENASDEDILFGIDSGAYTVRTNGGGGFRVDAAAAKFSREVAARYYGKSERIYGYIYGGSGGSFQTIGAMESSTGVWDGAVPFIPGAPTAIPNNFFARGLARFVLQEKAPQIADAVSPGGSGDPYIGLDEVERAVLLEVTKLGVPLRAWEDYDYVLCKRRGPFGFAGAVKGMDPTYADDFWSKPGYLGTEASGLGDRFRSAKVDHYAGIAAVNRNEKGEPTSLVLDSAPVDLTSFGFEYTLYAADGKTKVGQLEGSLDPSSKVFTIKDGADAGILGVLDAGAKLRIDNLWLLALSVYHRHQIPCGPNYYAWDQFKASDGSPLYPQRLLEVGPQISISVTGGSTWSGKIHGKVIMVTNLLDCDAYPWHADWYGARVREALGEGFKNSFQIWFNDNADHVEPHNAFLINYTGIFQQAVRDVSTWVETGTAPVQSTRYEVVDGQIRVPADVSSRGVQPVVDLTVNEGDTIEVTVGETVTFKAAIQVPQGTGKVVNAEWDFLGTGEFVERSRLDNPSVMVEVMETHAYAKPGNYLAALRASSQREGDANSEFTKIHNLGRVRVIVREG